MSTPTPAQINLQRLLEIIALLRSPKGCPWDRQQTRETLRPYLLEEAYEVLDALAGEDPSEVCDELGDLLLQIVLLARLHEESGQFDFADVCNRISEKLVRRHPHVFNQPDNSLSSLQLDQQWQRIKQEERALSSKPHRSSLQALPSLQLAQKITGAGETAQGPTDTELRNWLEDYLRTRASRASSPAEATLAELLLGLARSAACLEINAELALRQRLFYELKPKRDEKT